MVTEIIDETTKNGTHVVGTKAELVFESVEEMMRNKGEKKTTVRPVQTHRRILDRSRPDR
jgi:hypothetical protein